MVSFLSIEFALLFIAFFGIYWFFYKSTAVQNILLLIFGYFIIFMMAGLLPVLVLFIFSIGIAVIAHCITHFYQKKIFLITGIMLILVNLCFFKYYNFFIDDIKVRFFWDNESIATTLILPLGISYYSFMAISYLVDLYKLNINNTKTNTKTLGFSPIELFTHLSFFATLSAGPITRVYNTKGICDIFGQPTSLYIQIHSNNERKLQYPMLALALILLALIKKWWLAGILADNWVNPIFANPTQYHSLEILAGIYGYTLQLFLDFSGYSELMIGFGLLLGFKLPVNFNAPLLAHNIREFWNRWHISLSVWIRDYIYIPLGGSNTSFTKTQINLLIAMGLSGIWHGSTMNFLVWGLLHGLALVVLNCTDFLYAKATNTTIKNARNLSKNNAITQAVSVFLTVNFVVFCFVFFRATTFDESIGIFKALFYNYQNIAWQSNPIFILMIMAICWLVYPIVRHYSKNLPTVITQLPKSLCCVLLLLGFLMVVIFAPAGIPGFIYANF